MFIEAAFIIAKNWKPPKCLTTGEWNANCSLFIYRKVFSHSVISDSSWPHGRWPTKLFCPWGFSRQEYWSQLPCPLSGIFHPRDPAQVSHTAGRFFTVWATREAQECWSGQPLPSPGDLPNPGTELGSPASQADSYQRSHQEAPFWNTTHQFTRIRLIHVTPWVSFKIITQNGRNQIQKTASCMISKI